MNLDPRIRRKGFSLIVLALLLGLSFPEGACTSSGGGGDGDGDDGDEESSTACTSLTAPSSSSLWPMFHGFETHKGLSNARGPQTAGMVATFTASADPGNPPNSVAIADNGTVYLAGGGKVYSLTPSLAQNWSKSYSSAQGPALSEDGSTLYFGAGQTGDPMGPGKIVALNTSDGSEKWNFPTEGPLHFGPTVGPDGVIYQGSWDKNLYAVNPDGTLKWKYETAGAVSYPPSILNCADAAVGQLIILGGGDAHEGEDGNIYAFDTSGNLKWKYDTTRLRVGSPAIGADALIYAAAGPTLYVLDSTGELQWSFGDEKNGNLGIISPAIAPDGTVYVSNSGGPDAAQIYAIDPATHAVKSGWPFSATKGADNGIPTFPVVDSEGTVYFGDVANKSIFAVDKNGTQVFSLATGGKMAEAAPALVGGVLYISSDDGKLYMIGP